MDDYRLTRKEKAAIPLLCLLSSALFLMICSRSSFLYPFNDWVDVQIYFTTGKSIFNGKVLYKDIFEQKGLIIFLIYGIAYLISHTTLIGGYIMEVISMSWLTYLAYKTALYMSSKKTAAYMIALTPALATMFTYSFRQGGSSDELMLPFIYLPIYYLIKTYKLKKTIVPDRKAALAIGVATGVVLWCKYNSIAVAGVYAIAILIYCLRRKTFKELLSAVLFFALGVAIVTMPVMLYFIVNGAVKDMFTCYFYDNIFLYSGVKEDSSFMLNFTIALIAVFDFAVKDFPVFLFVLVGIGGAVSDFRKKKNAMSLTLIAMTLLDFVMVFGTGRYMTYYSEAFVIFALPGVGYALRFFEKKFKKKDFKFFTVIAAGLFVVLGILAPFVSKNTFYMKYKKEDLWQYQIASIVNESEDKSSLCANYLDLGIYTLTDTVPEEKFFSISNVQLPEMYSTVAQAVKDSRVEYLVLKDDVSDFYLENYEVVYHASSFYEYEDVPLEVYLLRRTAG